MCISYPGRVVGLDGASAVVDVVGRRRRATTLLLPDTAVGDWVMVGAGSILRRLDPAEAAALVRTLDAAQAATSAPSALSAPPAPSAQSAQSALPAQSATQGDRP